MRAELSGSRAADHVQDGAEAGVGGIRFRTPSVREDPLKKS